MAFVIIDKPISSLIKEYQFAIKTLRDHNRDDSAQHYQEQLRVILSYNERVKQRSRFSTLSKLKITNPSLYAKRCKELCKGVSGVSFSNRDQLFVVRPTVRGKRVYVGSLNSFDDAVEVLQTYIKTKIK